MGRLVTGILLIMAMVCNGQVEKVEPPNWWVGFKDQRLQLMLRGPELGSYDASIQHSKVVLEGTHRADSPNYLFLDLKIPKRTVPGTISIKLSREGNPNIYVSYDIAARSQDPSTFTGFNSSDVIYLITPDRFANGNPENDSMPGLREVGIDRVDDYARHGGDIQGIRDHLAYIDDMGFTAIWSGPLLLNDMKRTSYHGYAITDFYRVDPRFGTLDDYKALASDCRARGIKLIMDQVANHCGLHHWWMQDLPFRDWVNYQENYDDQRPAKYSNHRRTTNQDLYASKADKKRMNDGWFVDAMPDLNQRNPFMARYLVQNSIWWIETLGLGGIRQDTYPYPDKEFMSEWAGAITSEYPEFSIVGEEWSYNPLLVGYWQRGSQNKDGYKSNLRCTMDFPLQKAIIDGLTEEEDWDKGLIKIYEGLANDFHYPNPLDILLFADNHDMDRVFTSLGEDPVLVKMAMAFLLVAPRIPQIYYGTEILMENSSNPGDHGLIRKDFPGGWEDDTVNAFTGTGLSPLQKDMQEYMRKLLNFRKENQAIHKGSTLHFAPDNGTYLLTRSLENQTVVLILNKNDKTTILTLERFAELNLSGARMRNIITGETFVWGDKLMLPEKRAVILTKETTN